MKNGKKMIAKGWSVEAMRDAAVEATIEHYRFEESDQGHVDRTLARYGEEDGALFPDYDGLKALGVNVIGLAKALENGLDAEAFGKVLEGGLDIEGFNQTLDAGIDIPSFNEGMEHLVETQRLVVLHPDVVDRTMHHRGECGCHVA